MELTARQIADHLGGDVIGDENITVSAPARIEYGKKGNICFLANLKYEKYLYTTTASIVLVNRSFTPSAPVSATMVAVDDAYSAVAELLDWYSSLRKQKRRSSRFARLFKKCRVLGKVGKGTIVEDFVYIGRKATVGRDCTIYPQVYIGDNVKIGNNVVLYPGVKIYHDCEIGDGCILHAGCVIGADGFGFAPQGDGTWRKIQQTGNVIIEKNVEIGANTTVDRATMGSTIVHAGVKIDNLCMLAHNTEIGANSAMAAQCGIAGSTHVGESCIFAGQVGIAGHLHIAPHTTIGAQSGVIKDIKKSGEVLMGSPAFDHKDYVRASILFRNSGKSHGSTHTK